MNNLSTALAILSAMIAPAVLISACGSLILATSQRLSRAIDRTRKVSDEFEELAHTENDGEFVQEERALLFELLNKSAKRSRLLQQALNCLYLTLSTFVATSVSLGILALLAQRNINKYTWIPICLGMTGTGLLFYTTLLLIKESRIALKGVNREMDFVLRMSKSGAPAELLKRQRARRERLLRFF